MSDSQQTVRTRFAPSPTGFLHVGGVRTAMFAWLVARQADGQFILRIEDTDKTREVAGSEAHIMECLKWLNLKWDEGPDNGGPSGPYRQSERLDIYRQWAQKLVESGRAYADPYSTKELESFRTKAKADKKPFLFRDYRPQSPPEWEAGRPLRFKSEPKLYEWHDEVMGDLSSDEGAVDDFILIKSDGYPTYNFAHVVDDHLMDITHVIRSQEFLPSVPKFLNLYEALDIPRPKLATLPYVLGPDGKKKLSKRDGAKDILDYRQQGYMPEALISFLATLGWNDGTTQEIFRLNELIAKFSLDRVQRSGAKFDEQRLEWVDGHFIRELDTDKLFQVIPEDFWGDGAAADKDYKKAVLELVKDRLKYFSELPKLTGFFFKEPAPEKVRELYENPSDKLLKDISKDEYARLLKAAFERLEGAEFSADSLQKVFNELLEGLGTKPGVLFPILRIAVTGQPFSPEINKMLAVLGKEKTLSRLHAAIVLLDSPA